MAKFQMPKFRNQGRAILEKLRGKKGFPRRDIEVDPLPTGQEMRAVPPVLMPKVLPEKRRRREQEKAIRRMKPRLI